MEIEINKYDEYVQIVYDGYEGAFDKYRLVHEMTKELKVAALLEGRWVDFKINVRFRRGGKTSQDL